MNPISNQPSLSSGNVPQGADALKTFLLTTQGIKDKSSKEFGLSVCREIWQYTTTGLQGYFYNRNARFTKNRNYANGRIDIQAMFQDRFKFDGKSQNYIALNWNALQLVNRITSGLVGRWMRRREKIQVKAIDNLSQTKKKDEYEQLEFVIDNRRMLEQLEKESGVQIIPKDDKLPRDRDELKLWQERFQKIPEEIINELGCNSVLASNGWYDILKEKMLHDATETLFVATETYMDKAGVVHIKWLKPENCIYSYSDFPDFRDTTWRGYIPTRKISEIRKMWGKEFNPDNPNALTEQEIWQIAQKSKNFQYWNNIQFLDIWVMSYMRPYDEWNVRTVEFELRTIDNETYTKTTTALTGSTYIDKGLPKTRSGKPKPKSDNQEIVNDENWNIYRGVYLPDADRLLEWGLKDNMIRPQDPKEIGNAEFSYSFVMPQNYAMRNLAIPEKIEAAIDGMILSCLKMQQVVARMRPTGAAINEDALQNIDYGLGDAGNKAVDYKKLYDQTGDIYYKGYDAEGKPIPIPIIELQNNGFLGQMDGLIRNYQFWYQSLKDELGEDPNLISAAIQPRVTGQNVEASQSESENATDYIYRAYSECMKITSRKVSCLLKDSVEYGSKAYNHIINEEHTKNRVFTTDIEFLPTEQEILRFDAMMNQSLAASPELIKFINPFELMQVAKENTKLAWLMFNNGQKRMLLHEEQMQRENLQMTIQGQQESARIAEEEKRKTKEMEVDGDIKKSELVAQANNQTAVLNMVTTLMKPSADGMPAAAIPSELKPLVNAVIDNVMVRAIAGSEEQKQQIMNEIQMARQAQEQQQPMQQQNIQQQPPPQVAA